ncbi:metal-dependent hydrolase [Halobaculum sp. MBLA0147]|uniref:metal-dependent hydrolase n=1 Tax=Halobaculum sp. MBLA0147 TaxID=3079934 RepID=UPI0035239A12
MLGIGHQSLSTGIGILIASVMIVAGVPLLGLAAGFVIVSAARIPDADRNLPFATHRGRLHSLGGAVAFGLCYGVFYSVVGLLLSDIIPATWNPVGEFFIPVLAITGFLAGTVGVAIHLAADVVSKQGIPVLWPLRSETYALEWTTAASNRLNTLGMLIGGAAGLSGVGLVLMTL